MQQTVDVIIKVLDATASGLPTTGDINTILAYVLTLLFIAGCTFMLTSLARSSDKLKSKIKIVGGGAHMIALGFIALTLTVFTVVVVPPQAYAAPTPGTLTITVTKDSTQSVQSISPLSIGFTNSAGTGTVFKVSTTKSDLAQSTGTIAAPVALTDNTVGFALQANPTATPANLIPNGFASAYPTLDSVKGLSLPFAGINTTSGIDILQNEVTGSGTVTLYLSAKVSPTLAAGSYHIILNIETVSTTTTSVAGTIIWQDSSNADGLRPSTVDLELYKSVGGGAPIQVTGVTPTFSNTATDTWNYSFDNLPEFEGGLPVVYSVEGGIVAGYTMAQTGYDLTYSHTHTPGSGSILMAEPNLGGSDFLNTGIPRSSITSIIFTNTLPADGTLTDVSAASDGSVLASWNGTGTMTIGAAGGVIANPDCSGLFFELKLTALDLTHFSTPLTTNMMAMFYTATLPATFTSFPAGFGSQATNMNNAFNTATLPSLTSFPAGFGSEATVMRGMFESATLPSLTSFPTGFGSKTSEIVGMFAYVTLPSTFTSFPAGFGSQATNMNGAFESVTLPGLTSFPTGFGSQATNMNNAFQDATLPRLTSFPADFGSQATNMNNAFKTATLPATFTSFPAGFGSEATNMEGMFLAATLPGLTSFPADFGSQATVMDNMFYTATLPATFTSFPAGFGSQATSLNGMFYHATFPTDFTFPANFGSVADDMGGMFSYATLQGNIDWSQTTSFTNLASINVNNMFYNTNFGSYTLKVGSSAIQIKFTDLSTGISSPSSIVL